MLLMPLSGWSAAAQSKDGMVPEVAGGAERVVVGAAAAAAASAVGGSVVGRAGRGGYGVLLCR